MINDADKPAGNIYNLCQNLWDNPYLLFMNTYRLILEIIRVNVQVKTRVTVFRADNREMS